MQKTITVCDKCKKAISGKMVAHLHGAKLRHSYTPYGNHKYVVAVDFRDATLVFKASDLCVACYRDILDTVGRSLRRVRAGTPRPPSKPQPRRAIKVVD